MAEPNYDPDFDLEDQNQQFAEAPAQEAVQEEAPSMPKSRKKKKRRVNKEAAEGAAAQEGNADGLPPVRVSQEALPDIFDAPPHHQASVEEGQASVQEELEISDGEAPDVEEAKRNLRSQAEKKRKQKRPTTVGGVTEDVEVQQNEIPGVSAPATETPQAAELQQPSVQQQQPSTRLVTETPIAGSGLPGQDPLNRPGLGFGGDEQNPESEMDESGINSSNVQTNKNDGGVEVAQEVTTPMDNNQQSQKQQQFEEEEKLPPASQFEEVKLPAIGTGSVTQQQQEDSEALALQMQAQFDAEEDDGEEDEEVGNAGQNQRKRNRGKKGRRRARREEEAGVTPGTNPAGDLMFRDNVDIELTTQDFSREHFRKLIKKTFDDYYPLEYNKSTFNMDQYLDVVTHERLEQEYSTLLEVNDNNILTLRNMPWLDLGELPVSYNTNKSEAFQVYMIPSDEIPMNMVISFDNWRCRFDLTKANRVYGQTALQDRGIQLSDIQDTLQRATHLTKNFRGSLARRNRIVKLGYGAVGFMILLICVITGMSNPGNYWVPMLLVVAYLISVLVVSTVFKYRSSYKMRMSHFLLAVYCRAENNRLYLKHGVEVRPGFLGKWIEFTCLQNSQIEEIIAQMRQRFLKPCLEQKAAIFDKQIMNQRDLINEQADIERQIKADMANGPPSSREERERREVAQAVLESNPNDFSEEHELSMQAMAAQVNSQAAMANNNTDPVSLPPINGAETTPGQAEVAGGTKKNKKGKKKRKQRAEHLDAQQHMGN